MALPAGMARAYERQQFSQPDVRDVHTDAALTNMSQMFLQSPGAFVATRAFPIVMVDKKSDFYYTFDRNDFYRDEMKVRAPATESAGVGYNISSDTYSAMRWALHHDVPDEVRENADNPLNPDRHAVQLLTSHAQIRVERQWAADFFVTGIWGTSFTPATLWDDWTSDPATDVDTAIRTILASTGMKPNKLILGYDVFNKLKRHPLIAEQFKYTSSGNITEQLLAQVFGVDEVLVCQSVYATNVEGETAAYSFIQGKHALLVYAPNSPGIEVASAGYTFVWRNIAGGLGASAPISRIPMPLKKADRIEIEMYFDNKLTAASLGYFFESVVS
jgi:hypothetical protein